MLRLLLAVLLLLPSIAAAERVVTRSGAVYDGEPRLEGDFVIVRRSDGSEVRIPRAEVERVELAGEDRRSRPRYVPPAPPPVRASAAVASGLALAFGYHRGLSLGLEWHRHLRRSLALGLAAQVGTELVAPRGSLLTWGVDGRIYAGTTERFVGEVGLGLNLAKVAPCEGSGCPRFVRNVGPEISVGFQHMSHGGFFLEALGGIAFATEETIRADRAVSPTFQLSLGYLLH